METMEARTPPPLEGWGGGVRTNAAIVWTHPSPHPARGAGVQYMTMTGIPRVGSRRSRLVFAASVYAALIALTVVFLFPLVWIIGLSLKTRLQIFAMPPVFIWWPTLRELRRHARQRAIS